EFANRSLADRVTDARAAAFFGEERLIIVAAVDGVVVQQPGDATETDQTEGTVRHCAGRQQREVRPTTTVDRQLVNRSLVDVAGEVLLRGIDYRRFSTDVYRTGYGTNRKCDFKTCLAS